MDCQDLAILLALRKVVDAGHLAELIRPLRTHLDEELEPAGINVVHQGRRDRRSEQRAACRDLTTLHREVGLLGAGKSTDKLDLRTEQIFQNQRMRVTRRSCAGRTECRLTRLNFLE